MKFTAKILAFLLLFIFFLLIQSNRLFEISGVTPNLILIGFLILSLSSPRKEDLKLVIFIGIPLAAVALFWFPFWFWGIVIAVLFGVILSFLKNLLSGDAFIDFFLSAAVSTVIFYGVFGVIGSGIFLAPVILFELIYNIILGELALLVVKSRR